MYRIVTDTSANLPRSFIEENDLVVVPFSYLVNGVEHFETEGGFDGGEYYDILRSGHVVTTSQIPPQRFVEAMTPILENGDDILYVGMSSGISGAFQSSVIAAGELREKYPGREIRLVDTLAASLGEGIAVIRAVKLREQGVPLGETAEALEAMKGKICQLLLVDDLMYLRRTGRVGGVTAVIGSVLGVKPLLKGNEEGKLVVSARIRGRKQAIKEMARRYEALVRDAGSSVVGIAHADCEKDADALAEMISETVDPPEILKVCYGPVTGAHTGPDALALFFLGDDNVRYMY